MNKPQGKQDSAPAKQVYRELVTINGKTYVAFDRVAPLTDLRSQAGKTVTLGVKAPDGTTEAVQVTLRPVPRSQLIGGR